VAPSCLATSNLAGFGVDGEDPLRPGDHRPDDHGQADPSQTEHGHAASGLHLGGVAHGADAGGDTAAQQTHLSSSGARGSTVARAISGTTAYSEKFGVPMLSGRSMRPYFEGRLLPSGITPLPWAERIA